MSPRPSQAHLSYVPSYVDCSARYDEDGCAFASFVTCHNLPTAHLMPRSIMLLITEAYSLPLGTCAASRAARSARQVELTDTARGLLALHDMDLAA